MLELLLDVLVFHVPRDPAQTRLRLKVELTVATGADFMVLLNRSYLVDFFLDTSDKAATKTSHRTRTIRDDRSRRLHDNAHPNVCKQKMTLAVNENTNYRPAKRNR